MLVGSTNTIYSRFVDADGFYSECSAAAFADERSKIIYSVVMPISTPTPTPTPAPTVVAIPQATAPKIVSTFPLEKAINISLKPQLRIDFDQAIVITSSSIILTKQGSTQPASALSIKASGSSIFIVPTNSLTPKTSYILKIPKSAIKNSNGKSMETALGLRFRTGN